MSFLRYFSTCHFGYHSDITPDKMNHMLYLEVKDHDWFGRNDFIGCMAIPIKEIVEQKTLPLSWYKLLARSVGKEKYSRIPNDDEVSEVSLLVVMVIHFMCWYS